MADVREQGDAPVGGMTVSQLAERAGAPPRRIRYYVSEHLLPPPIGRGRAAHYTTEHLEILQQITALREVNLSLSEIRDRLEAMQRSAPEAKSPPVPDHVWRRWEIIPGVEMHAREDLDEWTLSTIKVMADAFRHLLENGEPEQESEADGRQ